MSEQGPAWLGIGAQRSGTGWLAGLLIQHPAMDFGLNGRKEQHALSQPGGPADPDAYRRLFPTDVRRGEWTPFYLRALSAPHIARQLTPAEAPILVLLRDPIDRFASSMRLWAMRKRRQESQPFGPVFGDAHWAGMYADQLDAWGRALGRERIMIFTYEAMRRDPQGVCNAIWQRLGLPPVPVRDVDRRSRSSAGHVTWAWPDGLLEALTTLYAPQVSRLGDDWVVDTTSWPNFRNQSAAS